MGPLDTATVTLPEGVTVREYRTHNDRPGYAVDGPGGHFLVTRGRFDPSWELWRSDSLGTLLRGGVRECVDRGAVLAARVPTVAL